MSYHSIYHGQILNAPGYEMSHLCHNKKCTNISHLTYEPCTVNQQRKSCNDPAMCHKVCVDHGNYPSCIFQWRYFENIIQHVMVAIQNNDAIQITMNIVSQWRTAWNICPHTYIYIHILLDKYRLFLVINTATMVLWHMMCFYTGQFIESPETQLWYFQQISGSFKFVRSLSFSLLQLNLFDFLLRLYESRYPSNPTTLAMDLFTTRESTRTARMTFSSIYFFDLL